MLSVTAYNWLHPEAGLPPAIAAKKLQQMRQVLRLILKIGVAKSPFARRQSSPARRPKELLLAGRDKARDAMTSLKKLGRLKSPHQASSSTPAVVPDPQIGAAKKDPSPPGTPT